MGAVAPGDYERQSRLYLKKLAEQGFELVQCIKMLATKLDERRSIPGTQTMKGFLQLVLWTPHWAVAHVAFP